MILYTERLILRPWDEADAESLYIYAKDDRVGPVAGWPIHKSQEESAEIIRTIFSDDEIYAVALKESNQAIGCIGLLIGEKSHFPISENEGEIAYWIGVPYWGRGMIPEAMREIMRHGFEDLNLTSLWCGYFAENEKSKRAQEKCGFRHHHTEENKFYELMGDIHTEHVSCITKDRWLKQLE
nr:GNAT family N-acetyltransferase [uncultured Moellerella sp.]